MFDTIKSFCNKTVTILILLAGLLLVLTLGTSYSNYKVEQGHAQIAAEYERANVFTKMFGNPFNAGNK